MSSGGDGPSKGLAGVSPASPNDNDDYDNICGICFTPIHPVDNPRGRLNSCDHLFCSFCISKWAESTNVCPHCKALFTRIFTWDAETMTEKCKKVRRRKFWNFGDPSDLLSSQEDDDSDSDTDTEWTEERLLRRSGQHTVQCEICHSDHNAARMIFCDRRECPFVAHLECLGLTEPPVTFLCPSCTALRQAATGELLAELHHESTPASVTVAVTATPAPAAPQRPASPTPPPPTPFSVKTPMALPPSLRTAAPRPASRAAAACPPPGPKSTRSMQPPAPENATIARTPLTRARVVVPDGPIDLAKAGLSALGADDVPREPRPTASDQDDSDYYFMVPNSHALSAFGELRRRQSELADIHQKERDKRAATARRYQDAFAATHPFTSLTELPSEPAGPGRKRPRARHGDKNSSQTDLMQQRLQSMESELTNPQTRTRLEDQLAREWARDMVPILRRNRSIDNNRLRLDSNMDIIIDKPKTTEDYQNEDRELWDEAMRSAREMARQKLDARAMAIRQKRQDLVKAQAQREAAALAKLARIIALHRQRDLESAKTKTV